MIRPHTLDSVYDNLTRTLSRAMLDPRLFEGTSNDLSPSLTEDFKPASALAGSVVVRKGSDESREYKLVGIMFCQPSHPLSKAEVNENLRYFHYRSGKNIDFYCAGYGSSWSASEYPDKESVSSTGSEDWLYSPSAFNTFRDQMEGLSTWKYSGGVDLLLINSFLDPNTSSVQLDLRSTIVCRLDEMKRIGAITSIMNFFEQIFQYAENQDRKNPTWGFSDQQGLAQVVSILKRLILALLPKSLGTDVEKLYHFAVLDVGKA